MADGNTKIDAPGYGEVIVLAGALMWALNLSGGGTGGGGNGPFDIVVTVVDGTNNTPVQGATVTGDTGLGSISGTTDSSGLITFSGVPAGSTGTLTATATGFNSGTFLVNPLVANINIVIPIISVTGPQIVVSGGSGDGTTVTFTVTASNTGGALSAIYAAFAHDSTGAPISSAQMPTTLVDGTTNPSLNWSPAITTAGTYNCTALVTNPTGLPLSNVVSFTITVGGGGGGGVQAVLSGGRSLTGADVEFASVVSGAPTAVPITYHATIKNSTGQTLQVDTVTHSQANGTYAVHVPTSPALTAGTYGITAFATDSTGGSISNTLNFNVTITGGGTGFTITVHTTNATTGANLGGARCTFGGTTVTTTTTGIATFNNVPAGTSGLITATHLNYRNATFTITNIQANLTVQIPMNPVSALRVVLANGSATGVNVTFHLAVTGAPAGGVPVSINAFAHDSTGTVVSSATQHTTITNSSTGNRTFSWNTSITTAGTYNATVVVSDTSGVPISNVLSIPFTISGGGGLSVLILGAIANATTLTVHYTISGAPNAVLEVIRASAHNSAGQAVATASHNVQRANGTYQDNAVWSTTIAPGSYTGSVFFVDSAGGSISGTLNFNFTV